MFSEGKCSDPKMLRGLLAWCALVRVNSQKWKGMSEVLGLALLAKNVPTPVIRLLTRLGICCSYQTTIKILEKQDSPISQVCSYNFEE